MSALSSSSKIPALVIPAKRARLSISSPEDDDDDDSVNDGEDNGLNQSVAEKKARKDARVS